MTLDPCDDFVNTLVAVFESDYQMAGEQARRLAHQIAHTYFSAEDVAGGHGVWSITLALNALCRDVMAGDVVSVEGCFVGLQLVGILRWMQGNHEVDHVEAATCMALVQQEAEAQPYSEEDTQEALLRRVNVLLKDAALGTIDKARLSEAMARLKVLDGLTSRKGWYSLKEAWTCQKVVE